MLITLCVVVQDVLQLTRVADHTIGDSAERGISGGEKKRVSGMCALSPLTSPLHLFLCLFVSTFSPHKHDSNAVCVVLCCWHYRAAVGMELVADPAILFLDEPTSGLDASSAKELMGALQRVAQRGLIVVAVIHQPRSEIYSMIDDLLLLRAGGYTVYFGEGAAAEPYFTWLGFPLPPNCNPADHQLDVVSARVPLRLAVPHASATSASPVLRSQPSGSATPALTLTTSSMGLHIHVEEKGASERKEKERESHISTTTSAAGAAPAPAPAPAPTTTTTLTVPLLPYNHPLLLTRRGSEAVEPLVRGPIAIPGSDVPQYLTEAWLNYRRAFASGRVMSLDRDVDIRCTQKQIDSVLMNSASPQLVAAVTGQSVANTSASPFAAASALGAASGGGNVNMPVVDAASLVILSLATLTLPALNSGAELPPARVMPVLPTSDPASPSAAAAAPAPAAAAAAATAPAPAAGAGAGLEMSILSISTRAPQVTAEAKAAAVAARPQTVETAEKEAARKADAHLVRLFLFVCLFVLCLLPKYSS